MPQPAFRGKLRITQKFGVNPAYYAKYGLKGHNGVDFIAIDDRGNKVSHPKMFSMLPGVWHLLSEQSAKYVTWKNPAGWYGYGAAWKLDFNEGNGMVKQFTFAHLQNRQKGLDNHNLGEGVAMAEMDNTGDSTGEHCHITLKQYKNGVLQNYGNGYHGALDPLPLLKKYGFNFV